MSKTDFQRPGFHTITPYLIINDASLLIQFIEQVFDGTLNARFDDDKSGRIIHAEMKIGDSNLMMGEPNDEFGSFNAGLYVYVEDCDAVHAKAVSKGATSIMEPTTMEHAGQRYGGVIDPTGNQWWIATHLEDVSIEEEKRRMEAG